MELFFELYFFQFFGPLGIMYFLVRCSVSVYLDLTETKRTKPKLPKHKNFGNFGSFRLSTGFTYSIFG